MPSSNRKVSNDSPAPSKLADAIKSDDEFKPVEPDLGCEKKGEEPHDSDPPPTPKKDIPTIKVPGITPRVGLDKPIHPDVPHFNWGEVTHGGQRQLLNDRMTWNAIALGKELERIREKCGPIHINSWYRDMESNKRAGGASQSMHLVAGAADIVLLKHKDKSGADQYKEIVKALGEFNGGVGIYSDRIHLDIGRKRRWRTC